MRLLLVGYGRIGRLVESLAGQYGCEIAGILDPTGPEGRSAAHPNGPEAREWGHVDVAIDFSLPAAVPVNVPALARRGIDLVVGTTGWQEHEAEIRRAVAQFDVGVVAAANFSTGVVLFEAIVAHAATLLAARDDFGAWLHEAHHARKKDAPSGTALVLKQAMERAGYTRPIDVSSTRAGYIPGNHTVGFDAQDQSIVLSHVARDPAMFARGALVAAHWVRGRRGWFTMKDVLGI
jgi:4-hydroxy-tetrahydrodipicolinate reductase